MNNEIFWLAVAGILTINILVLVFNLLRYYSLPSIKNYLRNNPDCKTESGLKCCYCNSKSIKLWGWKSPESWLKVFICNHCGTRLYRR